MTQSVSGFARDVLADEIGAAVAAWFVRHGLSGDLPGDANISCVVFFARAAVSMQFLLGNILARRCGARVALQNMSGPRVGRGLRKQCLLDVFEEFLDCRPVSDALCRCPLARVQGSQRD